MPLSGNATIIIGGLGRMSWPVLEYARVAGWAVVAIDQECKQEDPRLAGVRLVRGDYRDPAVLREAGIEQARGVMLLANDDLQNLAASLEVRRLHPTVRIVVRLFNENLVAKLGGAVSNVVALSSSRLAGPLLASTALTGELLGSFRWLEASWQIACVTVEEGSALSGQTWAELQSAHPDVHRVELVEEQPVRAGDRLVVIGPAAALEQLRIAAQAEEPLAVRWAGRVRRYLRTFWRTLQEIEWPVKTAALCFFTVLVSGSLIYWFTHPEPIPWPRALLRTLNIMVTSADLYERQYDGPWQHVFISFLKVAGLVLTAAFTALLTNYLVRARLGGALAVRSIPESGHVVLCGLGTVGIRVVETLRAAGTAVVVIEKVENSRFLAAARQKGATVFLGDGTLLTTLQRARTETARAFVAATSSDLGNVEMALLARELNPKLRVVLRLDDDLLADALRAAASIRFALGLPRLIAPAFVAPLLGDRVLSLFWLDGTLHLVMEVEIEEQSPLVGQCVVDLAERSGCNFVAGTDGVVQAGQRLLTIVPISRVDEVLRRGGA